MNLVKIKEGTNSLAFIFGIDCHILLCNISYVGISKL